MDDIEKEIRSMKRQIELLIIHIEKIYKRLGEPIERHIDTHSV